MRYVIIGAGAIGGTVGAHMIRAGHDVLLVDTALDHVVESASTFSSSATSSDFRVAAALWLLAPKQIRRNASSISGRPSGANKQQGDYGTYAHSLSGQGNGHRDDRLRALPGRATPTPCVPAPQSPAVPEKVILVVEDLVTYESCVNRSGQWGGATGI
ncbi:MAG: 2-dehydropantoate 2-reductase N-terminal domain-containing protein [Bacillota bacterium]|nr:2-dehydropantoate 2-reductase N-terminal domain-containing protein [Bacillota bacterium]